MTIFTKRVFWLSLAGFVTIAFAVFYVTVQQSLRFAANNPQNSMATDVAKHLAGGRDPKALVNGNIDMASSSAPFIIIYDQYGEVVVGNGYLDGTIPKVPIGVLVASKGHKSNSVTWQPEAKVRIASTSVQGGNYYVLGGRSLSQTESQISTFGIWLGVAWLVFMVLIVITFSLIVKKSSDLSASKRSDY